MRCVPGCIFLFSFSFFLFFFLGGGYETMSNCRQNCWIDWNSAALYFQRLLFDIGVCTSAQFVRPLSATIHFVREILYGSNKRLYNVSHIISLVGKTKTKPMPESL